MSDLHAGTPGERSQAVTPLRWFIVGLLFLAAVLNYIDKNTLSLLAPTIQEDLKLSDQQYANIQNAFQIAYTVSLIASGILVDRLGPRISLALFVGWWSLANCFTALARSASSLGIMRFALGIGALSCIQHAPCLTNFLENSWFICIII